MRVRLLRPVVYRHRDYAAGASIEVSDGLAASLIEGGVAEQARTFPPLTRKKEPARAHRA